MQLIIRVFMSLNITKVCYCKYILGTYNNQYMIIDLKRVELKKNIRDGALWVVEQIPTKIAAGDMTPILRTGKIVNQK